ncbi:AraC family transcriptional regulator [Starkeya koreensis]|uniref:AraC family transcriptional regulator n=1 Tax=Ancylobacter koreensis TaxID=266121 RepID=A0ABT0DHG3_9HYPH|nr:AraC family transcriptional regulator [Ancylobacter koreensis]MCK0206715.1 AraC family transcriptional regulator [Ancylobacter koreensis]
MSIHVSPTTARFQSRRADPTASAFSLAAPARQTRTADLPDDGFSVRLGHMGVVIAIGAAPATDVRFPEDSETIRLDADRHGLGRCADLLDGKGREAVTQAADPVVRRLSRALEAAEHDGREFGGLYADALRLAIVTRLLSTPALADVELPEAPFTVGDIAPIEAPAEAPADTPATAPRRPKSGLPKWRFKRVLAYIEENMGESVTLAGMAEAAGLSRMHFAAQFRVATGLRPHEFLLRRRIERAQQMLLETRDPLVEIALAVGFQTQAHFTTVFRRFVGDTPYQWRCANRARN